MCGILAILLSQMGEEELRGLALTLSKRLRHRGPDWSGLHIQSCPSFLNVLAHERLAIVDPLSGKQPLFDMTGDVCLTANGEIYNFKQLRDQVLVESPQSSPKSENETKHLSESDCAVIPTLFNIYGPSFVSSLDGMFAFVVSNRRTGEFLAARDPLGICPMYIGWGLDGALWFASECKALADNCLHFDIFPPGHLYSSTFNGGKGGFKRHFEPVWWPLDSPIPAQAYDGGAKIREALEAAVEKRLMSDVPFGVLLSGGLDSSIIAAIMARKFESLKQRENFKHMAMYNALHSFAIGLPGSPDLAAARLAAEYLGTEHHDFTFEVQEGIDCLRDVIYHLETYDVTTIRASIPLYLLSRMIRAMGIKFVLSGEGADEIFGGYLYFHKAPNKEEFHRETQRKLHALHTYDVLRANKAPMAFGLEVRVPFLDKKFLDVAMGVDPSEKMCTKERIEKWMLRSSFEGYLPSSILWRQKEQFSDGVGYSWIDGLRDHAEKKISDRQMETASIVFSHNTPTTKEAYLYRSIFSTLFPHAATLTVPGGPSIACSTATAIGWDESFRLNADQSGRSVIGVHHDGKQI